MKVSLQDFGFDQPNAPEINTPRSIEACRREGIIPRDIVKVPFDEFARQHKMSGLDAKGIELFYKHFEEKRDEKYRQLIKQRHLVIEDEKMGLLGTHQLQKSKYQGSSSLIEKEKQQLEKIKKRQQKEIESMMEYELKMQEIRQLNEKKLQEEKQKQQQRDAELLKKRLEQEELKRQRDLQKQLKYEQEQRELLEKQSQMEEKEKERLKLEEQKLKLREEETRKKEEEKKQLQEKLRKQNEENMRQQQEIMEKKRIEMEEKAEQRKLMMEEQKLKRQQESEQQRLQNEERIRLAKERNEQEQNKLREEMEKKIQQSEQKRLQFEEEKRKKLEQQRIEAEQHAEIIKKVIESNEQMEMEKKKEYLKKIDEAEKRRKQLEEESHRMMEAKRKADQEKEEQRHQVFSMNEIKQKQRIDEFMHKFSEKDQILQKVQKERFDQIADKRNYETLKRLDKKENVERIMRKQEYDREKLNKKLIEKMERADRIQGDLGDLLNQRQIMRREIDKQKRDIMVKLEKVREGKLPPIELQKQLGLTITDSKLITQYEQPSINRRAQSQGKSATSTINKSNKEDIKITASPQVKQPNQLSQTQGTNSSPQQDQIKVKISSPKKRKTEQRQETKPVEPPTLEVLNMLNDIIQKHNQEMMRVLMEEQTNENKRDEKLRNAKEENKAKLEKILGLERGKAQLRIQRLSDSHTNEQTEFKLRHNIS